MDEVADSAAEAEEKAAQAREAHAAARERELALRQPAQEADRKAQRLETEAKTLAKLLASGIDRRFTPVLEELTVAKGYEAALGAALGDDLDASADPAAPAHWADVGAGEADPPSPPASSRWPPMCRVRRR